jgi:hypothetical protein
MLKKVAVRMREAAYHIVKQHAALSLPPQLCLLRPAQIAQTLAHPAGEIEPVPAQEGEAGGLTNEKLIVRARARTEEEVVDADRVMQTFATGRQGVGCCVVLFKNGHSKLANDGRVAGGGSHRGHMPLVADRGRIGEPALRFAGSEGCILAVKGQPAGAANVIQDLRQELAEVGLSYIAHNCCWFERQRI